MPLPCITVGDPCGIGPECVLRTLAEPDFATPVTLVSSREVLNAVGDALCKTDPRFEQIVERFQAREADLYELVEVPESPGNLLPGAYHEANAASVESSLEIALELVRDRGCNLVTGPLDKRYFAAMGFPRSGHTEFLASKMAIESEPVMLFQGEDPLLSAVVLTRHIPLDQVKSRVSPELLENGVKMVARYNRRLATIDSRYARPMAVAGIDPHCGEWGEFSDSDLSIRQWVQALQRQGYSIEGPLAADTLFTPTRAAAYSTIFCWYHDQGMVPIKAYAFDSAVNVTLGLPTLRTSPAHGVAYDLAWKGQASTGSMANAIALAASHLD